MGLYQDVLESADGAAFVNLRDSAGSGITSTNVGGKQGLDVNLINSTTGGISDKTTFTYGTTMFQPMGGAFQDTSPALTAGQSGVVRLTADRAMHVNLRDASGNLVGDSNADGFWVKMGDGTNSASFSATSEQFVQIRQGGNIADVNASNQLLTADANSALILALIKSATGTITTPTVTTSSSTALAANSARKRFSVFNNSGFQVYLACAATATSSACTVAINPNTLWEPGFLYTGIVTMISPSVTGTPTIAVTEYT